MKGILEEAIACWESVVVATEEGAVGKDEALEQLEIVLPDLVTNVDGAAGDGPRRGVELRARVSRLEHVPVGVDEIAHPQAVVGAVHHVTPLQPEVVVRVTPLTRIIGTPKIVTYEQT